MNSHDSAVRPGSSEIDDVHCDIVFAGARTIDPETALDAVRNVGIRDGRIVSVSESMPSADAVIDASGRVLAPGFIDLHSHTQSTPGLRLRALDGVTTALELEAGALPVAEAYATAEEAGRPINFGFSASWALARMQLFDGVDLADHATHHDEPLWTWADHTGLPHWRESVSAKDIGRLVGLLEEQLYGGALGIGILVGYAPGTGRSEYLQLAQLAERRAVPTFTHTRFISNQEPDTSLEGAMEVVAASAGTGAHMHMCHLNSTSHRMIDDIADVITSARRFDVRVTTEAYPYGSGSTVIGAAFLHPDNLPRLGIQPSDLLYLPGGERIDSAARLQQLRDDDPGGFVVFDWLNEDDRSDREVLERSLLLRDTAIASDAMPLLHRTGPVSDDAWPLPKDTYTHPRTAGCYARTFRWLVRDLEVMSLAEAVRRCSLLPAQLLEQVAPTMRGKGRIQPGADADIVVFDPRVIADQATYADSANPSAGIEHVLVAGTFVVRDSSLMPDAMPGRPVYGRLREP